jgi:hypothetical protein
VTYTHDAERDDHGSVHQTDQAAGQEAAQRRDHRRRADQRQLRRDHRASAITEPTEQVDAPLAMTNSCRVR